jgi:hypothetical protein
MSSTYSTKPDRKLIFTQEILDEARRIENGESQKEKWLLHWERKNPL